MSYKRKIKVLIVDDSAIIRQALSFIFNSDPFIEVVATANDPYFAVKKIQKYQPDVVTLDLQMPRMDGLTFLKKLMKQNPVPVVIISSFSEEGNMNTIKALEYGAVDVVEKPSLSNDREIRESKLRLCNKIKAASLAKVKRHGTNTINNTNNLITKNKNSNTTRLNPGVKYSADVIIPEPISYKTTSLTEKIIAIGASTGGTEAIKDFLMRMPINAPGIVIVQHMPEKFTLSFANRLNQLCQIKVKEAENRDVVEKGVALIAPGNKHILLKRMGNRYFVEIVDGPLVNRHKPAVDVLFRSVAKYAGSNAIGIIMTGMGADGAKGLLEMKNAGATTAAQDEKTCVVFGMPKVAIKKGGVDKVLPLQMLAGFALRNL